MIYLDELYKFDCFICAVVGIYNPEATFIAILCYGETTETSHFIDRNSYFLTKSVYPHYVSRAHTSREKFQKVFEILEIFLQGRVFFLKFLEVFLENLDHAKFLNLHMSQEVLQSTLEYDKMRDHN